MTNTAIEGMTGQFSVDIAATVQAPLNSRPEPSMHVFETLLVLLLGATVLSILARGSAFPTRRCSPWAARCSPLYPAPRGSICRLS